MLTDSAGKRIGTTASGKTVAELGGVVFKNGDAVTIVTPPGAYKASLVGTGSGAVTIESDTPSGTSALRFRSKKRAKATATIRNGAGLGKIRFAGKTVKPVRGTPLAITRIPRTWREHVARPVTANMVVGPSGAPVIGASVTVRAGKGPLYRLSTDATGTLYGFWPALKRGRHTLRISAPGFATTKVRITVKKARR